MTSKPTPKNLDTYVAHTMSTLPDSLSLRKDVLTTLLWLLPPVYPERARIAKSLEALRIHEEAQLEFKSLL
jgi:hypothetical protein